MPRPQNVRRATPKPSSAEVDAYLAKLPEGMRGALQKLRGTIRAAAPGAEEIISYRVPAFRHHGRLLVWYAGFKEHASLFPGLLSRFPDLAPELKPYTAGRGTLRFTPEHPLPARLVSRIVRARIAELESSRDSRRKRI